MISANEAKKLSVINRNLNDSELSEKLMIDIEKKILSATKSGNFSIEYEAEWLSHNVAAEIKQKLELSEYDVDMYQTHWFSVKINISWR